MTPMLTFLRVHVHLGGGWEPQPQLVNAAHITRVERHDGAPTLHTADGSVLRLACTVADFCEMLNAVGCRVKQQSRDVPKKKPARKRKGNR